MKSNCEIKEIKASEVLDSRGMPTIKVKVILNDGTIGSAIVPSGASTGKYEAVELRDENKNYYNGKGVTKAVSNVNNIIAKEILGLNALNQVLVDKKLIEIDGTKNKERLGANSLLAVSLAVARAAANSLNLPLYKYLGGTCVSVMPVPMMNILNGGKHADNNVNIQEFMIMPIGAKSFSEGLRWSVNVYNSLKTLLKEKGYQTSVGDEGGFAPNLSCDEEALELLTKSIENAGFEPGKDFALALDVAASEMYIEEEKYHFFKTGEVRSSEEMIELYENFINKYPIISIEDGLGEEDFKNWTKLRKKLGDKVQLVGDDLFVTNTSRIKRGIKEKAANSVLIKVNQIGTLTEAIEAINLAKNNNMTAIVSHRSGETEDTFIADLAVACNCGQIKSGACARTERVAKYNRLLEIEEELENISTYKGKEIFYNLK